MKIPIACALAAVSLITGCIAWENHRGAGAEGDKNVLTGGPVTGITIADLPMAVKDTLRLRAGNAEVADIDRQRRDGRAIYKISFLDPTKNPAIYIAEDGEEEQPPNPKSAN
jgi:hypothetical protein